MLILNIKRFALIHPFKSPFRLIHIECVVSCVSEKFCELRDASHDTMRVAFTQGCNAWRKARRLQCETGVS